MVPKVTLARQFCTPNEPFSQHESIHFEQLTIQIEQFHTPKQSTRIHIAHL